MTGERNAQFDFVITTDLQRRHQYLDELGKSVLHGSTEAIGALGITARAEVSPDRLTAEFRMVVVGDVDSALLPSRLRLGDLLFNARATLDNVMWLITHDRPQSILTAREEQSIYFPICDDEQSWKSFLGGPVAKAIRPPLLERLESVQPFRRPDEATSRGLVYMHKLHREDKHRFPLTLSLILDAQMPTVFDVRPVESGVYEWWQDWLEFDKPIADGLPIMRVRLDRPMLQPPDTAVDLIPMASHDGRRYDLQDLVWDIQGAVLRAVDTVCLNQTFRAGLFDADIAWRRESLRALSRSMLEGTNEWEDRGFNRPSPFLAIYEELGKESPDLSKFDSPGDDAPG